MQRSRAWGELVNFQWVFEGYRVPPPPPPLIARLTLVAVSLYTTVNGLSHINYLGKKCFRHLHLFNFVDIFTIISSKEEIAIPQKHIHQ